MFVIFVCYRDSGYIVGLIDLIAPNKNTCIIMSTVFKFVYYQDIMHSIIIIAEIKCSVALKKNV